MKNKINIIITIAITIIIILSITYYYLNNREYTYICLNKEITKGECITKNYLEECTTNKKIPKNIVTDKSELLSNEIEELYCLIKDKYSPKEFLYKEDFELSREEKVTSQEIALLNELSVATMGDIKNGLPISTYDEPIKYNIYIKNNKLYAINLSTKEEKIIFDKEEVKHIAVRPYCCTGEGKLLILTTNGNVYISKYDCNYFFSFDFPFIKIDVKDIISFKLIPNNNDDIVKSLYGINTNNQEILIDKSTIFKE